MENDLNTTFLTPKTDIRTNSVKKPERHATSISAIDSAIRLFGLIFPLERAEAQEQILDQLLKIMKYTGVKISPGRKLSIQINSIVATTMALKSIGAKNGTLSTNRAPVIIQSLVEVYIILFRNN
jgi:hypothetical protein